MRTLYTRLYHPSLADLPTKDAQGRVYLFDNAKFLLIVLVVLGHFAQEIMQISRPAKALYLFIYSFHMPLFVFISGYLSQGVLRRSRFCVDKFLGFILLYGLLQTLLFLVRKYIGLAENYTYNFFGAEYASWYLLANAAWLGLAHLLREMNMRRVLPVTLLVGLAIGFEKQVGPYMSLSRIFVFFPFFVAGLAIGARPLNTLYKKDWLRGVGLVLLAAAAVFCFLYIDRIDFENIKIFYGRNAYVSIPLSLPVLRRAVWYLAASALGLAFLLLAPKGRTFFSKPGGRTLQVYFLHAVLIYLWRYLDGGEWLRDLFPLHWKYIWMAAGLALPFLLSWRPLGWPFNKVLGIFGKR